MKGFFILLILYCLDIFSVYCQVTDTDTVNNYPGGGSDWIKLNAIKPTLSCYLSSPESQDKMPGIILIHDEFGFTDWTKNISGEIAELGYLVVAPDLLSGVAPGGGNSGDFINEGMAREALRSLDHSKITGQLDLVYDFLLSNPLCNGSIMVIGFGWGGSQSFIYMTKNSGLAAGFVFYGKAPDKLRELERINAPVYGFYGDYDSRITSTIWKTNMQMKRLGKIYDPFIYKTGGHGFMRSGEGITGNEGNIKARTAAWKKLMELLGSFN